MMLLAARLGRFGLSINQRNHVLHAPQLVCDASRHRRAASQRFVYSHEVVIGEVERQRVRVVLSLFAERIGQPREPAHGHPHREVLSLGIAGADVLGSGTALHPRLDRACAFCRAVAARWTGRVAV